MDDILLDDVLYHAGVRGMKWGVRKQRPTGGGNRRSGTHAMSGDRLSRSKNSKKIAISKQVGKTVGLTVLTQVGAMGVGRISKSPSVSLGALGLSRIISVGVVAKGGMDIYGIAKYDQEKVYNG